MSDNPHADRSMRRAKQLLPDEPTEGQHGDPTGGARRDRTDDLLLAKQALSQLSYGPLFSGALTSRQCPPSLALRRDSLRFEGLAEPKPRSGEGWWAWEDLNFRPHAYQARALTN
jgi:hypothetical protein